MELLKTTEHKGYAFYYTVLSDSGERREIKSKTALDLKQIEAKSKELDDLPTDQEVLEERENEEAKVLLDKLISDVPAKVDETPGEWVERVKVEQLATNIGVTNG